MKTYIIINGKDVHVISKETIDEAIIYAQNYMDNSKEIIVREVNPYFKTNQA